MQSFFAYSVYAEIESSTRVVFLYSDLSLSFAPLSSKMLWKAHKEIWPYLELAAFKYKLHSASIPSTTQHKSLCSIWKGSINTYWPPKKDAYKPCLNVLLWYSLSAFHKGLKVECHPVPFCLLPHSAHHAVATKTTRESYTGNSHGGAMILRQWKSHPLKCSLWSTTSTTLTFPGVCSNSSIFFLL